MPIWIGGRTGRSLRRAVELGDGWMPFRLEPEALSAMLRKARDTKAWQDRAKPLELILRIEAPLDPIGAPQLAVDRIGELVEATATMVDVRIRADSVNHYLEQMEALRSL